MLVTIGLNWVTSAGYYVVFVWLITDLTKVAGLSLHDSMGIGVIGLAFGMALTPVMGHLCDRIGQRRCWLWPPRSPSSPSFPCCCLPIRAATSPALPHSWASPFVMAMFLGTMPAVFVSLFKAETRCSAMSMGYNVALALFGGTSPLIATYLVSSTGWSGAPGLYLAANRPCLPRPGAVRATPGR